MKQLGLLIKQEKGATLGEFALILPILLLFFIGVIDLARYFTIKVLLTAAAEKGVNEAAKMPDLDIDIRNKSSSDPDYLRFLAARAKVVNKTLQIPLSTMFTASNIASAANLLNINSLTAASNNDVAVLRPGECGEYTDLYNVTQKFCNKETLHLDNNTSPPDTPVADLMENHPIKVELYAKVETYLPIFGTLLVRGFALGKRENVPRGPTEDEQNAPGLAFEIPVAGENGEPFPMVSPVPTPLYPCNIDEIRNITNSIGLSGLALVSQPIAAPAPNFGNICASDGNGFKMPN